MFKIISVNCQGLGDIAKRKDVFNYFRSLGYYIYFWQDTHFTHDMENAVRNVGVPMLFQLISTNSRGTAMLINNNFDFKPLAEKGDPDGNYFILTYRGP
jgi:hypothetical protein